RDRSSARPLFAPLRRMTGSNPDHRSEACPCGAGILRGLGWPPVSNYSRPLGCASSRDPCNGGRLTGKSSPQPPQARGEAFPMRYGRHRLSLSLPNQASALATEWPGLYGSAMPWNNAFFIGGAALLVIAGAAAILSRAVKKSDRLLWAIAVTFLTATLA